MCRELQKAYPSRRPFFHFRLHRFSYKYPRGKGAGSSESFSPHLYIPREPLTVLHFSHGQSAGRIGFCLSYQAPSKALPRDGWSVFCPARAVSHRYLCWRGFLRLRPDVPNAATCLWVWEAWTEDMLIQPAALLRGFWRGVKRSPV